MVWRSMSRDDFYWNYSFELNGFNSGLVINVESAVGRQNRIRGIATKFRLREFWASRK